MVDDFSDAILLRHPYRRSMFDLEPHGPDTFVGQGPKYPWGGLYGGQIVAQSLMAAAETVSDDAFRSHSVRAYFIRRGDHSEPIRFEVDRIRNGRSFVTRRVVARQSIGAILNAECSFQINESSTTVQSIGMPAVPDPDRFENTSFSSHFDRRSIDQEDVHGSRDGIGRVTAWARVVESLDRRPVHHQCWLAYISDDLPADAVRTAHRTAWSGFEDLHGTSLDHTIWFHRPHRADDWHLYDFTCHHFVGSRGLAVGHVFARDGVHVATVAQEVLLREPLDVRSG
ncbi:MAG: acyl-CoA thioesterase [Actinomycetota bacterium]